MKDDKEFMVALEAGSVVVHTIDEVPELNFQPVISFALYRGGHANGGGLFTPAGFNHDLYEQLAETRGQSTGSLGNAQFYACWPGS